jgi:hypothetical protein
VASVANPLTVQPATYAASSSPVPRITSALAVLFRQWDIADSRDNSQDNRSVGRRFHQVRKNANQTPPRISTARQVLTNNSKSTEGFGSACLDVLEAVSGERGDLRYRNLRKCRAICRRLNYLCNINDLLAEGEELGSNLLRVA